MVTFYCVVDVCGTHSFWSFSRIYSAFLAVTNFNYNCNTKLIWVTLYCNHFVQIYNNSIVSSVPKLFIIYVCMCNAFSSKFKYENV